MGIANNKHDITIEQLQELGVRSKTLRYYLWFKHFVEVGKFDVAAYFLGKCWRRHGDLPEKWTALRDELDKAKLNHNETRSEESDER